MPRTAFAPLILFTLLAACGGQNTRQAQVQQAIDMSMAVAEPEELTYHPSLDVAIDQMLRLPTGVLYQDVVEGQGEPLASGQTALVRYTVWLTDGTEIDSNRDGEPLSFRVGAGQVIEGWDDGVVGMRSGGKRKLVLPPRTAYGDEGLGLVPPSATLVFDVELLEIRR